MLIRCDVHDSFDPREIDRCIQISDFLTRNGHRIGWAVPKTGYERFRQLLPDETPLFRLPLHENDELERIAHLHRKHAFRSILVNRHQVSSTYMFHLTRHFQQTILMDHQCKGMIYADMLINPDPASIRKKYDCHTATRLFLGPKFYLCDPKPMPVPALAPVTHMLLDVGDALEPAVRILKLLAGMNHLPIIHVLCNAKAAIAVEMANLEKKYPHLKAHPVLRPPGELFPYERYPVIIARAGKHCLDLARMGRFFLTLAVEKQEAEMAYALDQQNVAPTLGWLAAKEDEDVTAAIRHCLDNPEIRERHSRAAMEYVDGQGLMRIAHLLLKD